VPSTVLSLAQALSQYLLEQTPGIWLGLVVVVLVQLRLRWAKEVMKNQSFIYQRGELLLPCWIAVEHGPRSCTSLAFREMPL
jgi:hypothetical protein